MSNTSSTIKIEVAIDEKGVVRGFRDIGSESTKAGKQGKDAFDDMNSSVKNVDSGVKTTVSTLAKMGAAVAAAFTVAEIVEFTTEVVRAGVELDSLNASYEAIMGTAALAVEQMSFVNSLATDLGLNLPALEQAYKGILAASQDTALEGENVERVFEEISKASAVLRLSAEETKGALNALSQMISKGNVQAEELRGQLGERLPGAFNLAAEAMGVSTSELNKMLERGEVLAVDLLPALADVLEDKYGEAAEKAGETSAAAFENFQTAVLNLKRALAESGITDFMADMAKGATNVINLLTDSLTPSVDELETKLDDLRRMLIATNAEFYPDRVENLKNQMQELAAQIDSLKQRDLADIGFEIAEGMDQAADSTENMGTKASKAIADFHDAHQKATLTDFEYQIAKLDEQYDYFDQHVSDKLKLEEWYSAKLLAILDERKQDELDAMDWVLEAKVANIQAEVDAESEYWQMLIEQENAMIAREKEEYEKSLEEQEEAREDHLDRVRDAYDDLSSDVKDSLKDILSGAEDVGDALVDIFEDMAYDAAATFLAQEFVIPITLEIGSALGLSYGSVSYSDILTGSSSSSSIWSSLSSFGDDIWDFFSGSSTESLGLTSYASDWAGINAELSSGIDWASWGSTLGSMAVSAVFGLAISGIVEGFTSDDPDSFMVFDMIGEMTGDYYSERNESDYGYESWVGRLTGGDSELAAAMTDYFDSVFATVELYTNSTMTEILDSLPDGFRATVYPHEYDDYAEGALEDLSQLVFEEVIGAILLDMFPDQGTTTEWVERITDQFYNDTGGREGTQTFLDQTTEWVEKEVSALTEIFDDDFWKSITPEDGNEWDAFVRFAEVVSASDDFMADFNRQVEDYGEDTVTAFENLETIQTYLSAAEEAVQAVSTTDYAADVDEIVESWETLTAAMEEAHATTEQLAEAEAARNVVIGATLTGLTASTLETAIINGSDITDTVQSTLTQALAGSVANSIMETYLNDLNEAVGQAYLDSDGDLDSVLAVLDGYDLSGAQEEIDAFQDYIDEIFPEVADSAEEAAEEVEELSTALSGLDTSAIASAISSDDLEASLQETMAQAVIETYAATIAENYTDALNEELNAAYEESGDIQDVLDILMDWDFSDAEADIETFKDLVREVFPDAFGEVTEAAEAAEDASEAFGELRDNIDELNGVSDDFSDILGDLNANWNDISSTDVRNSWLDWLNDSDDETVAGWLDDNGIDLDRFTDMINTMIDLEEDLADAVEDATDSFEDLRDSIDDLNGVTDDFSDILSQYGDAWNDINSSDVRQNWLDWVQNTDDEDIYSWLTDNDIDLDRFTDMINTMIDLEDDLADAREDAADSYADLRDSIDELNGVSDDYSDILSGLNNNWNDFNDSTVRQNWLDWIYTSDDDTIQDWIEESGTDVDRFIEMINAMIDAEQELADAREELVQEVDEFRTSLTDIIADNTLDDYASSLRDLNEWYDEQVEKARELGESLTLVNEAYDAQLATILEDQATATRDDYLEGLGDEIDSLTESLDALSDAVDEATDTYISALEREIEVLEERQDELQTAYDDAQEAYVDGLESAISETESRIDELTSLSDDISEFRDSLNAAATSSEYDSARADWDAVVEGLASDDQDEVDEALANLTDAGQALLDAPVTDVQQQQNDLYEVIIAANQAGEQIDEELTTEEESLATMESTLAEVSDISDTTKSLEELAEDYYAAQTDLDEYSYEEQISHLSGILEKLEGSEDELVDLSTAAQAYYDAKQAYDESDHQDEIDHLTAIQDAVSATGETTTSLKALEVAWMDAQLALEADTGAKQLTELQGIRTVLEDMSVKTAADTGGSEKIAQALADPISDLGLDIDGLSVYVSSLADGVDDMTDAITDGVGIYATERLEDIFSGLDDSETVARLDQLLEALKAMMSVSGDQKKALTDIRTFIRRNAAGSPNHRLKAEVVQQ